MKKIWQKSLASMVSAALCLTAFVGCLTVNAATAYTGTITSTGATVAPTDAEATVKVTLASEALANTVAVQISSKYGALTAVKEVDTATEYYVDQDEIKLDEGKFFVHAKTNAADKGFTTAELVLTFAKAANVVEKDYEITIQAFAGHDGATYNEDTIDYVAANPIYIKVASSHTHTWDACVMTTMPTTTSDGVITYTCGCGETKQEAFSVSGTTIAERPEYTATEVAAVKVAYCARYYSTVFTGIVSNGGNLQSYGMLLTTDGTTPTFGEGTAKSLGEMTADNTLAKNKSLTGYYTGMNFDQMGQTLSFRPYVKFTLGEQECYYYGDVYTKVFIDQIRLNTDAQSIALVSLYNNNRTSATTTDEVCTGEVVVEGDSNIAVRPEYTVFNMNTTKIAYCARYYSTVFTGIVSNGGNLQSYGMLLTTDGTTPTFGEGTAKSLGEMTADNTLAKNKSLTGYYTGMNFDQMGQTLTFRPYVKYTDSEGVTSYVYGSAVSFVYIDVLNSLASDNSFTQELINYYNTYVQK